jgi:serine/threonine protein kinase
MAPTKRIVVKDVGGVKLSSNEGLQKLLENKNVESLIDDEGDMVLDFESLEDGGNYTLGPLVTLQGEDKQARFRRYLEEAGVTVNEEVMKIVVKYFSSSAVLVNSAEQAKDVFFEAAMLPRSSTKNALNQQGISVAGLYQGSDPSKAILLYANERGIPRILKIGTENSTNHELQVWREINPSDQHQDSHLVPLKWLDFQSGAIIQIGDVFVGSSSTPVVRGGILMKHYQGTLAQCTTPLEEEVLLRYGQQLKKAISTMHQAGYCHLDIKPSNVFLFEGDCFLGDYGASVKTGEPIRERTEKYYPKDGDFEAREETDMYLLAMTLMEMSGTIRPASERQEPLTKNQILDAVQSEPHENVRDFILSLFHKS